MSRVRTRYVLNPTGGIHVENLRVALYACLIAKYEGGDFPLRTEDTGQERFVEGAVEIIYQILKDAGLIRDEGPDKDGRCGLYVQNGYQTSGIYLEYAKKLMEKGETYYYFCTPGRLAASKATVNGEEVMTYDKHYLHLTKGEVGTNLIIGVPYAIHQNNPTTGITISRDEVYGDITMNNSELDDMVLTKSDGYPTYSFTNVVNDHLMDITHMVRGSEYLSSSPKYSRLYAVFGQDAPVYTHYPLTTDKSHHKLNKRNEYSSFEDLLRQSFISQVVANCTALLSWSSENNREVFTLEGTVKEFNYRRISKSPTVFDMTKLKWMNGEHTKAMDFDTFYEMAEPYLKMAASRDLDFKKMAPMIKTGIEVSPDIANHVDFSETPPEYDTAMYTHKEMKTNPETSLRVLEDVLPLLGTQGGFVNDTLYGILSKYVEDMRVKTSFVMWPIRTVVSDKQMTLTGATEVMEVLGKKESLVRIRRGIQVLEV